METGGGRIAMIAVRCDVFGSFYDRPRKDFHDDDDDSEDEDSGGMTSTSFYFVLGYYFE